MIEKPPVFIALLAHELRWSIVRLLSQSDRRVNEFVTALDQPMNLISYHLKQLRDGGLVGTRRSEADGRDIYYSLELETLHQRYTEISHMLHPALPGNHHNAKAGDAANRKRILFVCTHNSARSQMAEALMRQAAGDFVDVHSAGSHPTVIHVDTIRTMAKYDIDISQKRTSHVELYLNENFDYVITVCDRAREVCPRFPHGKQLHWGYADPAAVRDPAKRLEAFEKTARRLKTRIDFFLSEVLQVTAL
jgi:ArsR family transcriptional regulator, arsenate/arsenite/antimonite-responsive transcriptional repressor / arsenate reductase (thioredoxin)